jgi:hypothetical protein
MEQNQEQARKDAWLKSFAVAGFIAIIILLAWLSIKLVSTLPNAVSSLASIADTVYNYKKPEVNISSSKGSISTGETVNFSWEIPSQSGTFTIKNDCIEGVSVTLNGSIVLPCDNEFNLGSISGVDIAISSERFRFVDVPFLIGFVPNTSDVATATSSRSVTVTNISIAADSGTTVEVTPPSVVIPDVVEETPTTPTTPATPDTPVTTPPQYVTVKTPIYTIPVSNPNGYVDLSATFLSQGYLTTSRQYVVAPQLTSGVGAIQFAVKNIGTKTSGNWSYVVTLPNGTTYIAPQQAPLKPNERSTITLGFDMLGITAGNKSVVLAVTVTGDANLSNNSFAKTIVVR